LSSTACEIYKPSKRVKVLFEVESMEMKAVEGWTATWEMVKVFLTRGEVLRGGGQLEIAVVKTKILGCSRKASWTARVELQVSAMLLGSESTLKLVDALQELNVEQSSTIIRIRTRTLFEELALTNHSYQGYEVDVRNC
jgi:hypothetical protein